MTALLISQTTEAYNTSRLFITLVNTQYVESSVMFLLKL